MPTQQFISYRPNNGSIPFPVCQTVLSIPIETWVIYHVPGGLP